MMLVFRMRGDDVEYREYVDEILKFRAVVARNYVLEIKILLIISDSRKN